MVATSAAVALVYATVEEALWRGVYVACCPTIRGWGSSGQPWGSALARCAAGHSSLDRWARAVRRRGDGPRDVLGLGRVALALARRGPCVAPRDRCQRRAQRAVLPPSLTSSSRSGRASAAAARAKTRYATLAHRTRPSFDEARPGGTGLDRVMTERSVSAFGRRAVVRVARASGWNPSGAMTSRAALGSDPTTGRGPGRPCCRPPRTAGPPGRRTHRTTARAGRSPTCLRLPRGGSCRSRSPRRRRRRWRPGSRRARRAPRVEGTVAADVIEVR